MKTRKERRQEQRQKRKAAARLRSANNMCRHADDERTYSSEAEADADVVYDNILCELCNKPRLTVKVLNHMLANKRQAVKDYLR